MRCRETAQTPFIHYVRGMFSVQQTFGYLLSSLNCGIIAHLAPLWEAEGDSEVAEGLNDTWPTVANRPNILFDDRACKRKRNLIAHPDPLWEGTINIVDR